MVICSVSAFCMFWGVFGWIGEEGAIEVAEYALKRRGYTPQGEVIAELNGGQWTLYYPETEFKEIGLDQNGRMSWIGEF